MRPTESSDSGRAGGELTQLLLRWRAGDRDALDALMQG